MIISLSLDQARHITARKGSLRRETRRDEAPNRTNEIKKSLQ
jgi:hypothetical protein